MTAARRKTSQKESTVPIATILGIMVGGVAAGSALRNTDAIGPNLGAAIILGTVSLFIMGAIAYDKYKEGKKAAKPVSKVTTGFSVQ